MTIAEHLIKQICRVLFKKEWGLGAISCLVFWVSVPAQNSSFKWAKQVRGDSYYFGRSMVTDGDGNSYTTGIFQGTKDFDPGTGISNLVSSGTDEDIFILKLDSMGSFLWARKIGGASFKVVATIVLDAAGSIYTTGYFKGNLDADPGSANYNLYSGQYRTNGFATKYDRNGNFLWAKKIGDTTANVQALSIAVSAVGELCITGNFSGSADFDPGPASVMLQSTGASDVFITIFKANGDLVWAKKTAGINQSEASGISIDADEGGNFILAGQFTGTVDFDPGAASNTLTSTTGAINLFILKINSTGNFIWARQLEGSPVEATPYSLIVDNSGSIYVKSFFNGMIDFDAGAGVNNISGAYISVLLKLNASGDFAWTRQIGGESTGLNNFVNNSMCILNGNIYNTGSFTSSVDFDPGPEIYPMTAVGTRDIFILKLDTLGNFGWVVQMGGAGSEAGSNSVAVDAIENVYTAGMFKGTVDFDPGQPVYNLTPVGSNEIFIHKMRMCEFSTRSSLSATSCTSFVLNHARYDSTGVYKQTIFNQFGCDSIITLNLVINRFYNTLDTAICYGQSLLAGGVNRSISGTFTDTVQTTNGCDLVNIINLRVYPKIPLDLGANRNLCQGAEVILNVGQFNKYLWQDGTIQPTLTVNQTGNYWVKITDDKNCSGTDSISFLQYDTLPKNFLPKDFKLCPREEIAIKVPGYAKYLWSNASTMDKILIRAAGTYSLSVTNNKGCVGTDTILVQALTFCVPIRFPNVFSPDNNGVNDVFKPLISESAAKYFLIVYNRYGQKIFETENERSGWDGTFMGAPQPTGTYIFLSHFKARDGRNYNNQGSFLLIR